MGSSTKIVIPYHVTNSNLLKVIAKVMGCPFEKDTFKNYTAGKDYGQKPEFNPDLPVSNENKWHINFDNKSVYSDFGSAKDITNCYLNFKDLSEQSHGWFFMLEDAENEDGKILLPDSTIISVAVAKRIVDFFGGYAVFNNDKDIEDSPQYFYNYLDKDVQNVKMPAKKDINLDLTLPEYQNYTYNLFQNMLNNEPILTVKELDAAEKFASYNTDKDKVFYEKIMMYERELLIINRHDELHTKINDMLGLNENNTINKKVKI